MFVVVVTGGAAAAANVIVVVVVKRPALTPCIVDGRYRNTPYYYYL